MRRRILVLTPTFPYPPRSGGDIRVFHLLRHLAKNYDIHLLSLIGGPHDELERASGITSSHEFEPIWQTGLASRVRRKLQFWKGAPHGLSLSVDPAYAVRMSEVINETGCDAVLIEFLYMFQYAPFCGNLPVFFTAHNVETLKCQRWYEGQTLSWGQRWRCRCQLDAVRRLESSIGTRAGVVFATSEYDRNELDRMNRTGTFVVVPNGADPSYFTAREFSTFAGPPSVLFVGSLFYKPNADAVRFLVSEVMPILRRDLPGCECHIVGNTAGSDFSSLHQPEINVFLHGSVPDIRPFLRQSQVLAVPLFVGSGTRIKILESMASGTPVVSTRMGAEGIDYSEGIDICLAETAAEMARSISGLLRRPDLAYRMGQAGRSLVENKYTWARSAAIMHAAIGGVLSERTT